MKKAKNFLLSMQFFVVYSAIGIAFGFGVGYIVTILNNEGLFRSWEQLGGSQKFEQIADISFKTIWAKSVDEKLYSREFHCYREPNCDQWIEAEEISDDTNNAYEQLINKNNSCRILDFRFFRKPPGIPVECVQIQFYGMESETSASFVLLDDGTIWTWQFTSSMILDLIVPLFCSISGFVLGLIAFIVFIRQRRRKMKTPELIEGN